MIADHLSRLEKTAGKEKKTEIAENFLDEQLFLLSVQTPWYGDNVNYLACGVVPPEFSYQQRRKLRIDSRFYIWDDPLLFRREVDMIIWRCVPEIEQCGIMEKCHASKEQNIGNYGYIGTWILRKYRKISVDILTKISVMQKLTKIL